MGATITIEHGTSRPPRSVCGRFDHVSQKTVTGTENPRWAAVLAEGTTRLANCAREPEIVDLGSRWDGRSIDGVGTEEIVIEGGKPLHGRGTE
jgi:UDP-N-acetylglucosamine 1-carboxyvinyltransferase